MMNTAKAAVDPDASMDIIAPSPVSDGTGNTFTVNITLVNVNSMWGWSCIVKWNASVVNCTGKSLGPFNPTGGTLLGVIDNVKGEIPKLAFGTTEEDTKTGSGIVAFLTFKTLALGDVNLNVTTANYIDYPDKTKYDLPVTQATIIVVPEFPPFLIVPMFFIITAAIAIATKKRWMKKC
jgi:hypothetical protein